MRVTMVLCNLGVGGAETTALGLAASLQRSGVEVSAIALRSEGKIAPAYRQAGVELLSGLQKHRLDALALPRLVRQLKRTKPDAMIVIDAFRNSMFFGLVGAKLSGLGLRTILWSNSTPTGQLGDFTPRLRRYIRLGLLDEIVLTSLRQMEQFTSRGISADRISLIHNGVDIERFAQAKPGENSLPPAIADRPVVVQVANVVPDKDFDTLLQASVILAGQAARLPCVLLVGRGTDSSEMRSKIDQLGLCEVVFPLGARDDVPEILARADLLVLSTRSEVFNVSVLEAMASGLAVVASDIPAFDEMFADDQQGLKVPPGDAQALANGIGRLMNEPGLRARLAAAGQEHVQQFSQAAMTQKFAKLLKH